MHYFLFSFLRAFHFLVAIDVPKYLKWQLQKFTDGGGNTQRCRLKHIKEAFGENVDVVVNCTGLRASNLGGVEDQTMYPTRGQTILVRAPHVKSMKTLNGKVHFIIDISIYEFTLCECRKVYTIWLL